MTSNNDVRRTKIMTSHALFMTCLSRRDEFPWVQQAKAVLVAVVIARSVRVVIVIVNFVLQDKGTIEWWIVMWSLFSGHVAALVRSRWIG